MFVDVPDGGRPQESSGAIILKKRSLQRAASENAV
jgi:hypothetical protein